MFGEDKIKMYANADAYILPSHGEGLPMTILEAWSWKLPVVMTPHCLSLIHIYMSIAKREYIHDILQKEIDETGLKEIRKMHMSY